MYRLRIRHVVDIYIYIYIYIDIVLDVLDTSGESKNNTGPPSGSPKKRESMEELKELMEAKKFAMETLINEINKQENDIFDVESHVVDMSVQEELSPHLHHNMFQ